MQDNNKLYVRYLTDESLAYLVAGIFLVVSHIVHHYTVLLIIGHLLIGSSLLLALTTIFNNPERRRRIATNLDIFNGAVFILTFFVDIFLFLINELGIYSRLGQTIRSKFTLRTDVQAQHLLQIKNDSMFVAVMFAIIIWFIIQYFMPLILVVFSSKSSTRQKVLAYYGIGSLIFLALGSIFKFISIESIVNYVALIIAVAVATYIYLYPDNTHKFDFKKMFKREEVSDFFLVSAIVLSFSWLLLRYTKEFSPFWFFTLGITFWVGFLFINLNGTIRTIRLIGESVYNFIMFLIWMVFVFLAGFCMAISWWCQKIHWR